jgi:hypothetical protein
MKALLVTFAMILALMAWMAPDRVHPTGTSPPGIKSLPMDGYLNSAP